MNMIQTYRKVIKDYLEYVVLSDTITGTIVSTSPLQVRIDANITLSEDFLRMDKPIPPGAIGQSVSLQRNVGGQKFTILEKQFWR